MYFEGTIRKVDELGRIVLPIEMRRAADIATEDSMEIYLESGIFYMKKYNPTCLFCDEDENLIEYHGKKICPYCVEKLHQSCKSSENIDKQ